MNMMVDHHLFICEPYPDLVRTDDVNFILSSSFSRCENGFQWPVIVGQPCRVAALPDIR